MKRTKKLSPLWKTLRYAALAVLVLFLGLIVHLKFFVKDIPPFDDSLMKPKQRPAVPELLNGYTVLVQAAGRILCEPFAVSEVPEVKELSEKGRLSPKTVEKVKFKYKERFEMIERGAKLPYSQARLAASPNVRIPYILLIRNLAKLRLEIARQEFDGGESEKALETVKTMLGAGRILEMKDGGNILIFQMIAIAIRQDALKLLNYMLSKGYMPENAGALSGFLEKNKANPEAFKDAFRAEYQMANNGISDMGREDNSEWKYLKPGDLGWPLSSSFFRGMFFRENRARKTAYGYYYPFVAAMDKPCDPLMLEKQPFNQLLYPLSPRAVQLIFKGEFISEYMMASSLPNFYRTVPKKCFYDFQIEAMRLKLAALAYKKDKGALPQSLNDLAPGYIASVPADPFDGKPVRYDKSRGIVYSVGVNGKDDGGTADALLFSKEATKYRKVQVKVKDDKYSWITQKDFVLKIE